MIDIHDQQSLVLTPDLARYWPEPATPAIKKTSAQLFSAPIILIHFFVFLNSHTATKLRSRSKAPWLAINRLT